MKTNPILVIDDDEDIRTTLADILSSLGHEVHQAENGKIALELLETTGVPALIFLDRMMPVMDGTEFYSVLKSMNGFESVPVVMFSANLEIVQLDGLAGHIKKPAGLDVILSYVEKYCL